MWPHLPISHLEPHISATRFLRKVLEDSKALVATSIYPVGHRITETTDEPMISENHVCESGKS